MSRNYALKNVNPLLPNKTGFFLYISGAANSGKSTLLLSLLKNNYNKKFNNIFFFSPSVHTINADLLLNKSKIYTNLDSLDEILLKTSDAYKDGLQNGQVESTLIIIDDLINQFKRNNKTLLKLIYNRAHYNISLMITSQKFRELPLQYRSNASHIIQFGTKNISELDSFMNETNIFYNKQDFLKLIKEIFIKKYSFIYVNMIDNKCFKNFEEEIVED